MCTYIIYLLLNLFSVGPLSDPISPTPQSTSQPSFPDNKEELEPNSDAIEGNSDPIEGNRDTIEGNIEATGGNSDAIKDNSDATAGNSDVTERNSNVIKGDTTKESAARPQEAYEDADGGIPVYITQAAQTIATALSLEADEQFEQSIAAYRSAIGETYLNCGIPFSNW